MRTLVALLGLAMGPEAGAAEAAPVRLMTLDPGHFHAALIQKEMYPGVSDTVHVYAPLGPDLSAHLLRVAQFNLRAEKPTGWREEVHASPDFLERMLAEKPGNVVVLSGRNLGKIDRILASVKAGLNVLADKPWIIASADFPKLEATLDTAKAMGIVAYDVMTERSEITNVLQRELVGDAGVFGGIVAGTEAEPGLEMESVHHVMKTVAGVPNIRPGWFFDTTQQGEGLADVGTHLVDLVPWILFPDQALDYKKDVRVLAGRRWPTILTRADFERVTGLREFPTSLAGLVKDDRLDFFANTEVSYVLRGVQVRLRALWNYEAPAGGGDTHSAVARGKRLADRDPSGARAEVEDRDLRRAHRAAGPRGGKRPRSEDRFLAIALPGPDRRQGGRGVPRGRARALPHEPRGALRRGHGALPRLPRQPKNAARLGKGEHARQVLRDHEGHGAEPASPAKIVARGGQCGVWHPKLGD